MKRILIDSHAVAHSYKYNLMNLSHDDRSTGVIFGFLNTVMSIAERFETNQFVFAWESPGRETLKRKKIFPDYKKEKGELSDMDKELNALAIPQFKRLLFYILPDLGFRNIFFAPGYEADDIIAKVIKDNHLDEWVIVSGDEDLYQLLDRNVFLYDFGKKREFTFSDFIRKYDISPEEWVRVKALGGCSSDNVPGLPGIGEKTAIKYIKGLLPDNYKAYRTIEGSSEISFWKSLVKLPFDNMLPKYELVRDEFSVDSFFEVCMDNGFRSFLVGKRFDLWKKLFCSE